MERLTERGEDGKYFVRVSRGGDLMVGREERVFPGQEKWNCWWEYTVLGDIIDRLAAYEDTGLAPEEIKSLWAEWTVNLKVLESYRTKEAYHD